MSPTRFERPTGPTLEQLRAEMEQWRHRQAEQLRQLRESEGTTRRKRRRLWRWWK